MQDNPKAGEQAGATGRGPPALLPEGLVHGPIPANKGAGREEQSPQDRKAKARAGPFHCLSHAEPGQRRQEVEEEGHGAGCRREEKSGRGGGVSGPC